MEVHMKESLKTYLNHHKSLDFNELLFSYIDKSGFRDSEIYKKVDIDRRLFSKIRCNRNYIPKKNTVIKLGFALNLERYDFNKLLNSAGYSLKSNSDFDLVVAYCLDNKIYDIDVVNNYLFIFTNTVL